MHNRHSLPSAIAMLVCCLPSRDGATVGATLLDRHDRVAARFMDLVVREKRACKFSSRLKLYAASGLEMVWAHVWGAPLRGCTGAPPCGWPLATWPRASSSCPCLCRCGDATRCVSARRQAKRCCFDGEGATCFSLSPTSSIRSYQNLKNEEHHIVKIWPKRSL